jgi:hypothetical protein
MPDMTAKTVADLFFDEAICKHVCPVQLVSDRGTQVTSILFRRLNKRLEVKNAYFFTPKPKEWLKD